MWTKKIQNLLHCFSWNLVSISHAFICKCFCVISTEFVLRIMIAFFFFQCNQTKSAILVVFSTDNRKKICYSMLKCILQNSVTRHCWFLEHLNRQKSLTHIWQCFSCLLDKWIAKISKKIKFHGGFLR